jgi:hypothetical protein
MLLFKKKFLPAIRLGEKTQTIRLWKHRRMRAGQRSYIPGVGYIRVTAVDEIEIDGLTDADALPDGFETASLLRAELARLYPRELAAGYRAYRVRFRLLLDDCESAAEHSQQNVLDVEQRLGNGLGIVRNGQHDPRDAEQPNDKQDQSARVAAGLFAG